MPTRRLWSPRQPGNNHILSIGLLLSTFLATPFAIDIPTYFSVQQQLQTAVDSAALAGASKLPFSQYEAETAAYEMASQNPVAGRTLEPDELEFSYSGANMKVSANVQINTITAGLMCSLGSFIGGGNGKLANPPDDDEDMLEGQEGNGGGESDCESMSVTASAKAVPAPRDTILVIDTSNSMDDLGGNQPFKDVKNSAHSFLDMLINMNSDSVDRVGLVKFDKTASIKHSLVSEADAPGFSSVKVAINELSLYSGSGWNTNYEAGLDKALDELEAHGRPHAHKTVVFFTDGKPNLPGPSSPSIETCVNYYNKGQKSSAKSCANTYVNHMISQTKSQTNRAAAMNATIHTIEINDPDVGASLPLLQKLLQDNDWQPGLLEDMATRTDGDQFIAEATDTAAILEIFQKVAKIVTVKLTG